MWVYQEVVETAKTQIGYRPGGPEQGKFCDWFGRRANWCAMGTTWTFNETLGEELAKAVIGVQADAPNRRGWSWTVGLREWLQKNGTRIDIKACVVGDLLFFKYPTTGERDEAVVNHVEIVVAVDGNYITTIGFNTAEPGKADTLSNRGVYRVTYAINNRRFVDAYRPAYHNFPGIGYIPNGRDVYEVQRAAGVTPTGVYDTNTMKGVERLQTSLNNYGLNVDVDGLWGWGTNAAFDKYMAQVQVIRLAGPDRYATAVAVSKNNWSAGTADVVFLAAGKDFPDALSLSAAAGLGGGPLLLVPKDNLPNVVRDEIKRLKPTKIIVAGGDNVVSDAVVEAARQAAQSVQ